VEAEVLGQCNSWLKDGLRPRAMTRDLELGRARAAARRRRQGAVRLARCAHRLHQRHQAMGRPSTGSRSAPIGRKWWKADDTRLIHFIGKDNIVFHAIIFPILLKMHGGFILPQNVPANEFLNLEGRSSAPAATGPCGCTSTSNAGLTARMNCATPGHHHARVQKDSEFTWKDFQDKNNNELVAIIGNFVQRVFVLCHKYYEGKDLHRVLRPQMI
jgi:methionyl-tRNA synthetase